MLLDALTKVSSLRKFFSAKRELGPVRPGRCSLGPRLIQVSHASETMNDIGKVFAARARAFRDLDVPETPRLMKRRLNRRAADASERRDLADRQVA